MRTEQPGVTAFTELSDVPHTYSTFGGDVLQVKVTENGLEFGTGGGGGGVSVSYETVSKNLVASDAILSYTGNNLTSIAYFNGITKTLNYTGDNLTSVVLSGATPGGIDLVKTLSYTGDNLTGVTYS